MTHKLRTTRLKLLSSSVIDLKIPPDPRRKSKSQSLLLLISLSRMVSCSLLVCCPTVCLLFALWNAFLVFCFPLLTQDSPSLYKILLYSLLENVIFILLNVCLCVNRIQVRETGPKVKHIKVDRHQFYSSTFPLSFSIRAALFSGRCVALGGPRSR